MRGDEPQDVRHHGRVSNPMGLIRFVNHFAAGRYMECDRCDYQLSQRWRVLLLRT